MAILELVPKPSKTSDNIEEILAWLDRSKECVKEYGVTSIAIAWVDAKGGTGSGYVAYQPAALIGALEIIKREVLNAEIE